MATVSYPLPPWIGKPADPAAHYATGFQMGMHLGAEQAANIFREQQIERERQKDEFEAQLQDQRQALQVDQIVRKQRAIAQYQALVQGGSDPMTALQQIGPELADPAELVGMQQRHQIQQQQMQNLQGQRAAQLDLANRRLSETQQYHADALAARNKSDSGPVTPEIRDIGGYKWIVNPKTGHFQSVKQNVSKAQFIAQNVSKWMSEQGITDPNEAATRLSSFYDTYIEPPKAQPAGKQGVDLFKLTPEMKTPAADNQAPAAPEEASSDSESSQPEVKSDKILVRNPEGKIGKIPASQLDDALAMGYEEVQ